MPIFSAPVARCPNFALRRAVGATFTALLALFGRYSGFFAVCTLMLALGVAA